MNPSMQFGTQIGNEPMKFIELRLKWKMDEDIYHDINHGTSLFVHVPARLIRRGGKVPVADIIRIIEEVEQFPIQHQMDKM